MSSTAVVYIQDKAINESVKLRPYHEFSPFFRSLTSNHSPHAHIEKIHRRDGSRGFLVFYQRGDHLNYLFKPEVTEILNANNYEAQLSDRTGQDRNIFLVDVPTEITQKSKNEISQEISKTTDKIINARPMCGPRNGRNYLILTAVDNVSRDDIFSNIKTFELFGHTISCELPIARSLTSGDRTEHQRSNHRKSGNHTPSRGAASNTPSWNYDRDFPPFPHHRARHAHAKIQPKQPDFNLETDIKFYTHASIAIIKELHAGIEHPFEFVSALNETYSNSGLPVIDISHHQIMLSRKIYESKIAFHNNSPSSPSPIKPASPPSQASAPTSPNSPTPVTPIPPVQPITPNASAPATSISTSDTATPIPHVQSTSSNTITPITTTNITSKPTTSSNHQAQPLAIAHASTLSNAQTTTSFSPTFSSPISVPPTQPLILDPQPPAHNTRSAGQNQIQS